MQKEEWRDVKEYEGLYQVSSLGNVKSLNYRHTGREEILKPSMDTDGYLFVGFCKNWKRNQPRINRLVAITFNLPIPEHLKHIPIEELDVEHIDANKENNRLDNLRWNTHKGNMENPITRQRISEALKGIPKTEEHKCKISEALKGVPNVKLSKLLLQLDKTTGEVIKQWPSAKEVQRQLGFAQADISACCRGKRKSAYGFRWSYV